MWSFIAQYWNKVCVLLAGVTQHVRFHPFRAFCVGPCSRKAQYPRVYPRGTGLSPPHTPSCRKFPCLKLDLLEHGRYLPPHTPSCMKFHCLNLDSLEHKMCGLLWVARITWSTARSDSFGDHVAWAKCIVSHWPIFSKAKFVKMAKLRMKNWEIKLFLGVGMAKTSF